MSYFDQWLRSEVDNSREGRVLPDLKELPEEERKLKLSSFQLELEEKTGSWPFLQVWEARNYPVRLKDKKGRL